MGFAAQAQDRRLFDLSMQAALLKRENSQIDFEYNVLINKPTYTFHRFEVAIGLGYSFWRSTFSRPFDQSYFDDLTLPGRFIRDYNVHKIVFPLTGRFYVNPKRSINLQISALPAISIHRHISQRDRNYTVWEFSPHSLEINPGIGFKAGKHFEISLNYRAYNLMKLDRIIFNGILFRERDPEFLKQKTDTYNPFKLWLSVGYVF